MKLIFNKLSSFFVFIFSKTKIMFLRVYSFFKNFFSIFSISGGYIVSSINAFFSGVRLRLITYMDAKIDRLYFNSKPFLLPYEYFYDNPLLSDYDEEEEGIWTLAEDLVPVCDGSITTDSQQFWYIFLNFYGLSIFLLTSFDVFNYNNEYGSLSNKMTYIEYIEMLKEQGEPELWNNFFFEVGRNGEFLRSRLREPVVRAELKKYLGELADKQFYEDFENAWIRYRTPIVEARLKAQRDAELDPLNPKYDMWDTSSGEKKLRKRWDLFAREKARAVRAAKWAAEQKIEAEAASKRLEAAKLAKKEAAVRALYERASEIKKLLTSNNSD